MLRCWDDQPHNRPTFKDLRSKFDAMLLADKKDEYIDLRIDQSKSYYQNLPHPAPTTPTASNEKAKGSSTSLNVHAKSTASKSNSKERLSKPAANGDLCSPSPGENDAIDRARVNSLASARQTRAASAERIAGNSSRTYENTGRPVSMYLSRDEKKHENPYVDEPSRRIAAAALTLPNTNGWPEQLRDSEGGVMMMEMNPVENANQWNGGQHQCPEIQICPCEEEM